MEMQNLNEIAFEILKKKNKVEESPDIETYSWLIYF